MAFEQESTSLYLHIPFCHRRCSYCDFNTYAGMERMIPAYVRALCSEIRQVADKAGERLPVHTIFFGGGTPSILPLDAMAQILDTLSEVFQLLPGLEMTLEANPGTVTDHYLKGLHDAGFNRISFGMQSANPEELRLLRRIHGYREVADAVSFARQAGFNNLNLDLIFSLPGQSLASWQQTVERALDLHPEHFSLYSLIVEPETAMHRWVGRGLVESPDEDRAADMYEWAAERLEAAGYAQYEISNWANRAADGTVRACRHNLQYWRNLPYLGFGAGAHGYCRGIRTANVLGIDAFIRQCRLGEELSTGPFPLGPALASSTEIGLEEEMQETLMVGLRLTEEGVSRLAFRARFGQELEEVFAEPVTRLIRQNLLEWHGPALRLTQAGRLLGNMVFREFVGEGERLG